MAKAAWCSQCNANVYLTDEGACPMGHGTESLSNFYDVPDLTPAEHAVMDAAAPAEKAKSNRTVIIVLAIVGVIVLCGVASCVAGVAGLAAFSKSSDESVEPVIETSSSAGSASDADSLMPGVDLQSEIYSMVGYFHPGFEPTGYYLVGEATTDPVEFQVIAAATAQPEFQLAFTAYRYADTPITDADDPAWYFGADSGALWERSSLAGEGAATLYEFAGADPLLSSEELTQIMNDFVSAHPGMIVTEFTVNSESQFTLAGISEAELEDWQGDTSSFESVWDGDTTSGTWSESSFTENGS